MWPTCMSTEHPNVCANCTPDFEEFGTFDYGVDNVENLPPPIPVTYS